ncbi:MAG TPA: efflux RND transporter periplasmic adaptor subunit [Flavobacteriaceae bacterium]|nr:efflux RND transporter periplasmic adaptor subunit [Flavobacteriaceae bacterium]
MKKSILIIISFLILLSCKKEVKEIPLPTSIAGLKLEKSKQEKVKDSISKIIVKIENKLSELDTVKKLALVSTIKISSSHYEHFISIQGNTKTDKNIMVRPLGNGIITGVFVKEGQRVKKGQKMFQLDDAILKNTIYEVKNQLILAQTSFERQKRLWNQKIGSEMQFLQAKNNKESLENKIKTLNSQLKNYRITAPFNGIIDDLIATNGNLASPQTPLAKIINLNNMYIESDVAENFLKSIKKGNKAIVNLESIEEKIITKIAQIGNTINSENRTFKIRINLNNKKGLIKPNLLANIKIKDLDIKNAIVIPSKLVQIDENGNNFVFTVTKQNNKNIVTKKTVKVESTYQNISYISEGLNKDEVLINEGSRNVSLGQEIEIL